MSLTRFGLIVKGSKDPGDRQDVSQECKIVEAKQLLLRREEFEFQREAISLMET